MPGTFYAIIGLVAGSFLNVCIHRLPAGESIAYPPSHCPHCGTRLAARDLVPVLSYLALGRRCRECLSPISAKYPLVELLTGIVYFLAAAHSHNEVMFLKNLVFLSAMIVVIFTDLEHMIIPDAVSLPLIGAGIAFAAAPYAARAVGLEIGPAAPALPEALLASAAGFGAFYALAVIGEMILKTEAMGGGDIKLAAGMGAFLGWQMLLLGLFLAFFLGSVIGLVLMAAGGGGMRRRQIPFGPMMAAGGMIAVFYTGPLIDWYTGMLDRIWSMT